MDTMELITQQSGTDDALVAYIDLQDSRIVVTQKSPNFDDCREIRCFEGED